jgi:hypothetical protein
MPIFPMGGPRRTASIALLTGHRSIRSQPGSTGTCEPSVNRDRGELRSSTPPTPPYIRVRIRRFGELSCRCPRGETGGRAFVAHRRRGFGPYIAAPSGFTLRSWRAGRAVPGSAVWPPRDARCYSPRSPFGPSLGRRLPTMPSADFCAAITRLAARSVRRSGHDADLPR